MATFDEHASKYDMWFLNNKKLLETEAKLVAYFMKDCGAALSVGCGSGLFESIMKKDYGIEVSHGIEPSRGMAEIAEKRGINVQLATAEEADYGESQWDTILFNGTPSYIKDLATALTRAFKALKTGGRIVLVDVPKESSYGMIYNLAKTLGTWDHPLLKGAQPPDPYPIAFVQEANWRSTAEKIALLQEAGFKELDFAQTLTCHPVFSNDAVEEPSPGYTRGDYVAICGYKR